MIDDEPPACPRSPSRLWKFWWVPFLVAFLVGSIIATKSDGSDRDPADRRGSRRRLVSISRPTGLAVAGAAMTEVGRAPGSPFCLAMAAVSALASLGAGRGRGVGFCLGSDIRAQADLEEFHHDAHSYGHTADSQRSVLWHETGLANHATDIFSGLRSTRLARFG